MSKQKLTLNVIGNSDELVEFVRLCGKIQGCGEKGITKTFKVTVDGDGSSHLKFSALEETDKGPVETDVPSIINDNPYINIGE